MPIGKDSIRKRVIGAECEECGACEKKPVAKEKAPAAAAPKKAPAKKAPAKRAPAKKKPTAAPAPEVAPAEPAVTGSVLANVSPAVVEAVVGHKEGEQVEHIQILDDMPSYLL